MPLLYRAQVNIGECSVFLRLLGLGRLAELYGYRMRLFDKAFLFHQTHPTRPLDWKLVSYLFVACGL